MSANKQNDQYLKNPIIPFLQLIGMILIICLIVVASSVFAKLYFDFKYDFGDVASWFTFIFGTAVGLAGAWVAIKIASIATEAQKLGLKLQEESNQHSINANTIQQTAIQAQIDFAKIEERIQLNALNAQQAANDREEKSFQRETRLTQYNFMQKVAGEVTPIYSKISSSLKKIYSGYVRTNENLEEPLLKFYINELKEDLNCLALNISDLHNNFYAYRFSRNCFKEEETLNAIFNSLTKMQLSVRNNPSEVSNIIYQRGSMLNENTAKDFHVSKAISKLSDKGRGVSKGRGASELLGIGALIWWREGVYQEKKCVYNLGAAIIIDIAKLLPDEQEVCESLQSLFEDIFDKGHLTIKFDSLLAGYNPYSWLGESLIQALSEFEKNPISSLIVNFPNEETR